MFAAPMIMAWFLGISVSLLEEARALMVAVLIYLGYVIIVVLIILQLKADSTRDKLALSKLVVRSKIENGGLSAVSCIVAFRSNSTKDIRFALDDVEFMMDSELNRKLLQRSRSLLAEPGSEFPVSVQPVSFAPPISIGSTAKVIEGRLAFRVKYRSNSIFQYSFAQVLGFRLVSSPGRALSFEWKSLNP